MIEYLIPNTFSNSSGAEKKISRQHNKSMTLLASGQKRCITQTSGVTTGQNPGYGELKLIMIAIVYMTYLRFLISLKKCIKVEVLYLYVF